MRRVSAEDCEFATARLGTGTLMTKSHLWRSRLMQTTVHCTGEHLQGKRSSRSRNLRNRSRFKKHVSALAMKASLRGILQDSFFDRERSEIVSLNDSAEIDVIRGEVLRSPRYSRVFRFGDQS